MLHQLCTTYFSTKCVSSCTDHVYFENCLTLLGVIHTVTYPANTTKKIDSNPSLMAARHAFLLPANEVAGR